MYGIPYDHKIGEEGAKEEEAETLVKSEADTDRKGKNMHRSASEEGGPKSISITLLDSSFDEHEG